MRTKIILFDKIKRLYQQKTINQIEYKALQKMRAGNVLYVLSKELFLKNFTKYFKLLRIDHAKKFRYFQFTELILGKKIK